MGFFLDCLGKDCLMACAIEATPAASAQNGRQHKRYSRTAYNASLLHARTAEATIYKADHQVAKTDRQGSVQTNPFRSI
jgi:hypothetical protein